MNRAITHNTIVECSTSLDGRSHDALESRAKFLVSGLFGGNGADTAANLAADVIIDTVSNTVFEGYGDEGTRTIPHGLAVDQVEDWLVGQAITAVLTVDDLHKDIAARQQLQGANL